MPINLNQQLNSSALEIRVYPGRNATTEIYNDNGIDFGYKNGKSSTIKIKWDDNKRELVIDKREGKFDEMLESIPMKVIIVNGTNENDYITKSFVYNGKKKYRVIY